MSTPKNAATLLLLATSLVGARFIFGSIASTQHLFPVLERAKQSGSFPDGLPLRQKYTSLPPVDALLTGIVGCFSLLVDGQDEAAHRFALWFLPQLSVLLAFMYWEAGRTRSFLVRFPTVFGLLLQLFSAGVVLPLYFVVHILTSPSFSVRYPTDAVARARALLPAITIAFFLPSAILFLAPASVSLDQKQIIAALWQGFPVYVTITFNLLRWLGSSPAAYNANQRDDAASETQRRIAFAWVKGTYIACGLASAIAHIVLLLGPCVTSGHPLATFKDIFIPEPLYPIIYYSPPRAGPGSIPQYREAVRIFFQYDWLATTAAAFIFFGWSRIARRDAYVSWLGPMVVIGVLGGPGAALAWAALEREEHGILGGKAANPLA